MSKLEIKSSEAMKALGGLSDSFKLVSNEIVDEYRWGNIYELVLEDSDGNFWIAIYQEQIGNYYHNSLEDYDTVELTQAIPVEEVRVYYQAISE